MPVREIIVTAVAISAQKSDKGSPGSNGFTLQAKIILPVAFCDSELVPLELCQIVDVGLTCYIWS